MLSQSKDWQYREDWQHILTFGILVNTPGFIYIHIIMYMQDTYLQIGYRLRATQRS